MTKYTQSFQCPDTGIALLATLNGEDGILTVELEDDDDYLKEHGYSTYDIESTEEWCREANNTAPFAGTECASRWLERLGAEDIGVWEYEQ